MQYANEDFEEFADDFIRGLQQNDRIVFTERLQRDALDFSIESLKHVDEYLNYVFQNRPRPKGWVNKLQSFFGNRNLDLPEGRDWITTVLWGGAYVGEVIRRNAPRKYNWVGFDDWIREHPEQVQILGSEKALQVCTLLTQESGAFTLPLNKVYKFICEGIEESTWFYADCEVRE